MMVKPSRFTLNKIHEIGITIQPEIKDSDPELGPCEDFYGSDLDDSDDQYVNDNFREGDKTTDAVLCCAMCFTPLCYQCKVFGGSFLSKSAVNIYVDEEPDDSSGPGGVSELEGQGDSNKRKLRKDGGESEKRAKCIECGNVVAVLDASNNYVFKHVIASQP